METKKKNNQDKDKVNFRYNAKTYWNFVKKYKWLYAILIFVTLVVEGERVAEKYLLKIIIDDGTKFTAGTLSLEAITKIFLISRTLF